MKKAPAKKAPAKMTMKKSGIKKAQDGINTDSITAKINKQAKAKSKPTHIGEMIDNEIKRIQTKKAKEFGEKGMKKLGIEPPKQKNGGRTKK